LHKLLGFIYPNVNVTRKPENMDDYKSRVESQIRQYEFVENMHDLPPIFHLFSHDHIRPRAQEVFDSDSIPGLFASGLSQGAPRSGSYRFVSIGSGDASYEIDVARAMVADGYVDFTIECTEISPFMNGRAREQIAAAGMTKHLTVTQTDINTWVSDKLYDGAMTHHALHHIVELEHLFLNVKRALKPGANFVVADMIGRNGHMRWPEVLEYVEQIWSFLPEQKKLNHQLKRLEASFVNFDCSSEGFEGIRAQDILPLMLDQFSFRSFAAWGGLIDIFIDRAFGWNFDPKNDADRNLIAFIARLNEDLIQAGRIKPTQMFAIVTPSPVIAPPRLYAGLTPEFAVRWPTVDTP